MFCLEKTLFGCIVLLQNEFNVKKAPLLISIKDAMKGVGFRNPDFIIIYDIVHSKHDNVHHKKILESEISGALLYSA